MENHQFNEYGSHMGGFGMHSGSFSFGDSSNTTALFGMPNNSTPLTFGGSSSTPDRNGLFFSPTRYFSESTQTSPFKTSPLKKSPVKVQYVTIRKKRKLSDSKESRKKSRSSKPLTPLIVRSSFPKFNRKNKNRVTRFSARNKESWRMSYTYYSSSKEYVFKTEIGEGILLSGSLTIDLPSIWDNSLMMKSDDIKNMGGKTILLSNDWWVQFVLGTKGRFLKRIILRKDF